MANSDYQILPSSGPFAPVMELDEDIMFLDEFVKVRKYIEPYPNALVNGMTVFLGNEMTVLLAFTMGTNPDDPEGPQVATQLRLLRGCGDTVPTRHSAGDLVWVIDTFMGDVEKEYAAGDEVSVKILPFLPGGRRLPIERESPEHLVFNWRFFRPYPPAQMRANGARWWIKHQLNADNPIISLTWVSRNRIEQYDQLIGHDEAEIAGELGQSYTARVYDHTGTLVRTEPGLTARVYNYTWSQAIADFGVGTSVGGEEFEGWMEFESSRDGLASWTRYALPIVLNNKNVFMFAALTSEQTAQRSIEADLPQTINVAQIAEQAATGDQLPSQHLLMSAQIAEQASQRTSFYTPLVRYLVEAPYIHLLRRGMVTDTNRVMTSTARPSDRLTDTHMVYGRGSTTSDFAKRDDPPWTAWVRIDENMDPLQQIVSYSETSLNDGVAIPDVVGRMAYLAGEIVRVDAINATHLTLARGCADTVPAFQKKTARLWFFDNAAGLDGPVTTYNDGTKVEDKIVPGVYGPPLELSQVPTDIVTIASRTPRPYPPGYVKLNGLAWYLGWRAAPGTSMVVTWHQRNRLTQGSNIIDHNAPNIPHEVGTRYRLLLEIVVRGEGGQSSKVKIREMFSDTLSFEYTYDMARTDGMRAGQLLKACGQVTVPAYLDAIRDGRTNWQGYSFPMTLPSYTCPINQPPGGGQGPIGGGNGGQGPGNGGGGGGTGGGGEGGGGGDTDPPVDPNPPTWPPITPETPDPEGPGEPDPEDTDPDPDDNGEHWDYRWDLHWDAYRRRPGNNQGEG